MTSADDPTPPAAEPAPSAPPGRPLGPGPAGPDPADAGPADLRPADPDPADAGASGLADPGTPGNPTSPDGSAGLAGPGDRGGPDGSTGRHPDLDALAGLDAGVLDAGPAGEIAGHVQTCRQCTASRAALRQVRADLAALPTPALPVDVAGRFDQTIAALRAQGPPGRPGSGGPAVTAPEAARPVDVMAAARRRRAERADRPGRTRRPPRWTGWAAAVVAVLTLGAGALAIGRQHSTTTSAASGGAAQSPVAAASNAQKDHQYRGNGNPSGGAAVPNPASLKPPPPAAAGTTRPGPGSPSAAPTSYTQATIGQAVTDLEHRSHLLPLATSENSDGLTGPLATPMRLAACLAALGETGRPTGAEQISYDLIPGYLLVFTSGGAHPFYVVGQDCGSGGSALLFKG